MVGMNHQNETRYDVSFLVSADVEMGTDYCQSSIVESVYIADAF